MIAYQGGDKDCEERKVNCVAAGKGWSRKVFCLKLKAKSLHLNAPSNSQSKERKQAKVCGG